MSKDDIISDLPEQENGVKFKTTHIRKEEKFVSMEMQEKELLVREIEQRIRIRFWTLVLAASTIVFMMLFLVYAMSRYFTDYFFGSFVFIPSSLAVALVVTPIMFISAITVTILIGSFRSLKQKDAGGVDMTSLAAEAMKSSLGS